MRAVAGPGRWVWVLSGLVTAAVLAVPGARLIDRAVAGSQRRDGTGGSGGAAQRRQRLD